MTARHGKSFQEKCLLLATRSAAAAFLSVALVFSAVSGAKAQVVAADPLPPCCVFQKEPRFESWVSVKAFDSARSVTQSYYDLIRKFDPLDPDPNKKPIFLAEIDYGLEASLDGRGQVNNSISSLPFRPGGPHFQASTIMAAEYTEPGKALVGAERFSFIRFEGNAQRGSAIAGGLQFSTRLIQGNASSHVEFDTVTRQFEAGYLGEGIGAAGIGIEIEAVSGASGVNTGSQSYSGSISVAGDYRVRYSASGGPSGGCFFGW